MFEWGSSKDRLDKRGVCLYVAWCGVGGYLDLPDSLYSLILGGGVGDHSVRWGSSM